VNPGDLVILNTQEGPKMTVGDVSNNVANVLWFVDNHLCYGQIPVAALEEVENG
jgi:hypothetical protein